MAMNTLGIDHNRDHAHIEPIARLASEDFTIGPCGVVPYVRTNLALFGNDILSRLYDLCVLSRPSHPYGILPDAMCGCVDLSRDAILAYWYTRRISLVVLTRSLYPEMFPESSPCWDNRALLADGSEIIGFTYLTNIIGTPANFLNQTKEAQMKGPRAAVAAYVFFRPWWGTAEQDVDMMLGLAYLFHTYNLKAIHGQRYTRNALTANYTGKFGFRDMGTIPYFLLDRRDGKDYGEAQLVPCTVTTLTRDDFNTYIQNQFIGVDDTVTP